MRSKHDYIHEAFQIWCKVYNQEGDDWVVYYERGRWFGMTRHNTIPIAKYLIHFKQVGDIADFCAGLIYRYGGRLP